MFSKSKINDPIETRDDAPAAPAESLGASLPVQKSMPSKSREAAVAPRSSAAPSMLCADMTVTGNLMTEGDLQIEGRVDGDIDANVLLIGKDAFVGGEIRANEVVVNGHVKGRIRGTKVRLAETARVEGDILHASIAIEAGAHFEGSVRRADDPLTASGPSAQQAGAPAPKPPNLTVQQPASDKAAAS